MGSNSSNRHEKSATSDETKGSTNALGPGRRAFIQYKGSRYARGFLPANMFDVAARQGISIIMSDDERRT